MYFELFKQGVDWLAEVSKACRQNNLSPWLSVRMNDMHNVKIDESPWHSGHPLQKPQLRLSDKLPQPGRGRFRQLGGLNYEHQEVRDYMFTAIRELIEDYDFEGLELDWLRRPICCEPNPSLKTTEMITSWHQEIKALTSSRASRTGRPYYLGMRVLGDFGQMRSIGIDIPAMARRGIIDWVSAGNIHQGSWNVPYDELREACDSNITLYGVVNTESNWLHCRNDQTGTIGYRRLHMTPESVWGNAAGKLVLGAEGIETFNFFLQESPGDSKEERRDWWQAFPYLRSLEDLRGKPKYYTLSTINPGGKGPFVPNEDIPEELPVLLRPTWRRKFRIPMCAEPDGQSLRLVVQVVAEQKTGTGDIGVSFNGTWPDFQPEETENLLFPFVSRNQSSAFSHREDWLTKHLNEYQSFNYHFPVSLINDGWNNVTVYYDHAPDRDNESTQNLCIQSIELGVKQTEE